MPAGKATSQIRSKPKLRSSPVKKAAPVKNSMPSTSDQQNIPEAKPGMHSVLKVRNMKRLQCLRVTTVSKKYNSTEKLCFITAYTQCSNKLLLFFKYRIRCNSYVRTILSKLLVIRYCCQLLRETNRTALNPFCLTMSISLSTDRFSIMSWSSVELVWSIHSVA